MEKLQISLAAARVNANMSQDQVAKRLGISKQTIVNWEKGRTCPTMSQFRTLGELYSMPISNIFIPEKTN